MNEPDPPPATDTELTLIRDFLPEMPSTSAPAPDDHASWWTDPDRSAARAASIRRHLDAGWDLDAKGLLVRGEGRSKVEERPTELMPSKSGYPDFNPAHDAFAVRLGAEFVGPNRYRLGSVDIDANGACRDPDECSECGSTPVVRNPDGSVRSGGEYRFNVRVEAPPGANVKPWESVWTYCERCCTDAEIDAFRAAMSAVPAKQPRRGARR